MGATFKMVTVVGTSPNSIEEAVQSAVRDASRTLRNIAWFEVKETRGRVDKSQVAEYQVKLQLGFKVDAD